MLPLLLLLISFSLFLHPLSCLFPVVSPFIPPFDRSISVPLITCSVFHSLCSSSVFKLSTIFAIILLSFSCLFGDCLFSFICAFRNLHFSFYIRRLVFIQSCVSFFLLIYFLRWLKGTIMRFNKLISLFALRFELHLQYTVTALCPSLFLQETHWLSLTPFQVHFLPFQLSSLFPVCCTVNSKNINPSWRPQGHSTFLLLSSISLPPCYEHKYLEYQRNYPSE